jgi:hypothetical protein
MGRRSFWRMRDSELRLKLTTAKRNLVKLGYEHICSVMTSDRTNREYGSKFSKLDGSAAMWVNIETVDRTIARTEALLAGRARIDAVREIAPYVRDAAAFYTNNSDSDSPAEFSPNSGPSAPYTANQENNRDALTERTTQNG